MARETETRPEEVQLGKAPCDSHAPRARRRGRQSRSRGGLRRRPPAGRHEHDDPEALPAPKVVPERLDHVRTEVHAEDEGGLGVRGLPGGEGIHVIRRLADALHVVQRDVQAKAYRVPMATQGRGGRRQNSRRR